MSETIAVTRATGLIGRHLVNCLLTDGYEVRALARRQNDGLPASVEVIHGSVEQSVGDRRFTMQAGDTVFIARGSSHQSRNIGLGDAIMIVSYSAGERIYETLRESQPDER